MPVTLTADGGASLKDRQYRDLVRFMVYRDQHGRRWSGNASRETGVPEGTVTPHGWRAPFAMLYPPAKYLTYALDGDMGLVTVDYDRWLIDTADAWSDYQNWLMQVAQKHFGAAAIQKIEEQDANLVALAGPSPMHIEFVRAMKAGNKWALGIPRSDGTPYPMPPWAAKYERTLMTREAFDGADIGLTVNAADYPDVEDETALARYDALTEYEDLEDAVDPIPTPKRGPGRPRKTLPLDHEVG